MLKKIAKFFGEFKDGKLTLDRPKIFKTWAKSQTGRFELTVGKESEDVTQQQWGYYFACVVGTAVNNGDFEGWTADEIDGYLCKKFLTVDKGTLKERVKSKSRCTREEIAKFIDESIMDLAGNGIIVLPPNKIWTK